LKKEKLQPFDAERRQLAVAFPDKGNDMQQQVIRRIIEEGANKEPPVIVKVYIFPIFIENQQ
jgi:hypothetical protein